MKNLLAIILLAVASLLAACTQPFEAAQESAAPDHLVASPATLAPWMPNCVGPTSFGLDPADGCDDGNPCTRDVIVDGACTHTVDGFGTSCSDDGTMGCWSGQCCPAYGERVDCYAEGVRDACAEGSLCFEGRCWIGCGADGKACGGTEFPTCAVKSVGSVSVQICE